MIVKQIDLVFENCECIKLDYIPYKNWFTASDIAEFVCIVNGNEIHKDKIAKSMQIVIPNDQLYQKSQIGTPLIEKLEHRDITSVYLIYADDSEEKFCVLWDHDESGSDYTNDYQHNEFKDDCVVININNKYFP